MDSPTQPNENPNFDFPALPPMPLVILHDARLAIRFFIHAVRTRVMSIIEAGHRNQTPNSTTSITAALAKDLAQYAPDLRPESEPRIELLSSTPEVHEEEGIPARQILNSLAALMPSQRERFPAGFVYWIKLLEARIIEKIKTMPEDQPDCPICYKRYLREVTPARIVPYTLAYKATLGYKAPPDTRPPLRNIAIGKRQFVYTATPHLGIRSFVKHCSPRPTSRGLESDDTLDMWKSSLGKKIFEIQYLTDI